MSFALFTRAAQSRDPQAGVAATAQALERVLAAANPAGDALGGALHSLSTALGGRRAFVLRIEPDTDDTGEPHRWMYCLHEWVARASDALRNRFGRIEVPASGLLRDWIDRLEAGDIVNVRTGTPPEPVPIALCRPDTQALVMAPVTVRQQLWGIVGLDSRRGDALFNDDDSSLLQVFGRVLGLALERRAWRDDYADLEARSGWTDTRAQEAFCVHDRKGRFVYVSAGYLGITGFRPEQVIGHDSLRSIDRQDRPALREAITRLQNEGRATLCCRYNGAEGRQVWLQIELQRLVDDPRGAWLSWICRCRGSSRAPRSSCRRSAMA